MGVFALGGKVFFALPIMTLPQCETTVSGPWSSQWSPWGWWFLPKCNSVTLHWRLSWTADHRDDFGGSLDSRRPHGPLQGLTPGEPRGMVPHWAPNPFRMRCVLRV